MVILLIKRWWVCHCCRQVTLPLTQEAGDWASDWNCSRYMERSSYELCPASAWLDATHQNLFPFHSYDGSTDRPTWFEAEVVLLCLQQVIRHPVVTKLDQKVRSKDKAQIKMRNCPPGACSTSTNASNIKFVNTTLNWQCLKRIIFSEFKFPWKFMFT